MGAAEALKSRCDYLIRTIPSPAPRSRLSDAECRSIREWQTGQSSEGCGNESLFYEWRVTRSEPRKHTFWKAIPFLVHPARRLDRQENTARIIDGAGQFPSWLKKLGGFANRQDLLGTRQWPVRTWAVPSQEGEPFVQPSIGWAHRAVRSEVSNTTRRSRRRLSTASTGWD